MVTPGMLGDDLGLQRRLFHMEGRRSNKWPYPHCLLTLRTFNIGCTVS